MTKKLILFNTIQNRVKKGLDDLVSEIKQFIDLGDESITEDKDQLQKKLDFVQDQFKRLEEELETQAVEITADQLTGCNNSVESIRTTINAHANTARTYIRDFIKKSKKASYKSTARPCSLVGKDAGSVSKMGSCSTSRATKFKVPLTSICTAASSLKILPKRLTLQSRLMATIGHFS